MTVSDTYDPLAVLKAALGEGHPELAAGLMDLFIEDAPGRLEALRLALENRDPEALSRAAFILKGSAQTVEIRSMVALAEQLEELGRLGRWEGTEFLSHRLEDEFVRLCRRLHVRLEDLPPCRTRPNPRG